MKRRDFLKNVGLLKKYRVDEIISDIEEQQKTTKAANAA